MSPLNSVGFLHYSLGTRAPQPHASDKEQVDFRSSSTADLTWVPHKEEPKAAFDVTTLSGGVRSGSRPDRQGEGGRQEGEPT